MKEPKNQLPATIEARAERATGATEQFEHLGELAAGQYWRALSDIPGKKATYREVSRGESKSNGRAAVKAGTVLLVKSLRHADGGLHTIIMAPHPLEPNGEDRRYLATEFFSLFERALDADKVRHYEIGQVEAEISKLQTELVQGPKDMPLIAPPTQTPSLNALVANAGAVEELKKRTQLSVEFAQKRSEWVQNKVAVLGEHTGTLARFHEEQAVAALAIAEDTIRYADHLQTGIKTLGLYTGENVKVRRLVKGKPAPAGEKLTMYQRRLFLDEEFIVHLRDGGADHNDLGNFARALAKDQSLIDRILPAQRSVVLMRYRRKDKEYFRSGDVENRVAKALANAVMNQENMMTFLLIRNGDNIYQVWSEVATDAAVRLFPTKMDLKNVYRRSYDFFRGVEGDEITPEDLLYTEAKESHAKVDLFYKRLLVLLWGLNDRLNMFGDFYDKKGWTSWLTLDFQARNFVFVHDDEDALTDGRPEFYDWAASHNKLAQPGSRVLGIWSKLMVPETAPGACVYGGRNHDVVEFRYKPIERHSVLIARKAKEDLAVHVPCKYNSWRDVKRKETEIQVFIGARLRRSVSSGANLLVLDSVKSEDLTYYLNSRRHRANYLEYMEAFFAARDWLRAEEAEAKPFTDTLRASLAAAGIADKVSADDLDGAIAEAVRLWRANRYGRKVPAPGDAAWKTALKEIGQQIWRILKLGDDPTTAVEKAALDLGHRPLRLVSRGDGKLILYAEPKDAETFDLDGPFPWAVRFEARIAKSGAARLENQAFAMVPAISASERILHDWPTAESWIAARAGLKLPDHDEVVGVKEGLAAALKIKTVLGRAKAMSDAEFDRVVEEIRSWTYRLSKRSRMVQEPTLVVPLAPVAVRPGNKDHRGQDVQQPSHGKAYVLVAEARPVTILWSHATPAQREKIKDRLLSIYKHRDRAVERIEEQLAGKAGQWLWFQLVSLRDIKGVIAGLECSNFLVAEGLRGHPISRPETTAGWNKAIEKSTRGYNVINHTVSSRQIRFLDWGIDWQKRSDDILSAHPRLKRDDETQED